MKTPFEDFYAVVAADDRSQTLDRGNVQSAFNSVRSLSVRYFYTLFTVFYVLICLCKRRLFSFQRNYTHKHPMATR